MDATRQRLYITLTYTTSELMNCRLTILTLFVLLLASRTTPTYACSCVHNPKWTLKREVNSVDIVVKGRIISVTDYSDSNPPWKCKLFRFLIENKYKIPFSTPDTISVITGQDGSSCGYTFRTGKEYILYGRIKSQKNATIDLPPEKSTKKPIQTASHTMFETDICTLTKEANKKELTKLKRLTK